MKKFLVLLVSFFLLLVVSAPSAQAASPHFKRGGEPVCTITASGSSTSTTCRAVLAGLGNQDLLATVSVSGFAVYQCQNNGGNIAPGQNRVLVGPSTTPTLIDSSAIKNGNLTFTTNPAQLSAPSTVSGSAAGCPGSNWTGVHPQLTVTSIELSIAQAGNTFYDCTVSNPNGLTGTVSFPASC